MSFKKALSTLILILLVYAWFFLVHQPSHPTSLKVLGANTNIALFVEPDSGHQPILDAINSAKSEILVEVYLLSDKQVIAALEEAKMRGVDVRVMMEQHPFGGGNLNPKTKNELDSKGVATAWSKPSFALTHEKSIVIDAHEVFVLSQNLTGTSFTKNREYDILDTNPADVAYVRTIFIDDWERKSFTPPAVSDLIESPNTSRAALTTLIGGATKTIEIETEDINDSQIINLLIERAKSAKVELLIPSFSQLAANKDAAETLASGGVEVKTISSPYMHAKMILIDDTKAYVGSINLSGQSMDENRELGIILTQRDSIQTINSTFESDWNRGALFKE